MLIEKWEYIHVEQVRENVTKPDLPYRVEIKSTVGAGHKWILLTTILYNNAHCRSQTFHIHVYFT